MYREGHADIIERSFTMQPFAQDKWFLLNHRFCVFLDKEINLGQFNAATQSAKQKILSTMITNREM